MTISEARDILALELDPDLEKERASQGDLEEATKIAVDVLSDVLHGDLEKYA